MQKSNTSTGTFSASSFAVVVLVTALLAGCGGSGGGGSISGPDTSGFTIHLVAMDTLIEAGERADLSVFIQDANGNYLQGQVLRLAVHNSDSAGEEIGWITRTEVVTDTTNVLGTRETTQFISTGSGTAIIRGTYHGSSGMPLDSTDETIEVVTSLHFIDLTIHPPDTIFTGDRAQLFCVLWRGGSQETAVPVSGKQVVFSPYLAGSPGNQFGQIIPNYSAITDKDDADGLEGDYYFTSNVAGTAVVLATYTNPLGRPASVDSVVITVADQ